MSLEYYSYECINKCQFSKLEPHLQISRDVNDKLSEKLINLELKYYANKQYSREKCLEISNIWPDMADKNIENNNCWEFWFQLTTLLAQIW